MEMRQVAMSRRPVALFAVAVVAAASVLAPPRPALATAAAVTSDDVVVALPGCTSHCGNISIPHPFGVEPGCYLPGFNVTCRNNSSLFLGDGSVQVLEISIPNATVRINASFAYFPGSHDHHHETYSAVPITNGTWSGALGEGGVYSLALKRNRMFVVGCNVQVLLVGYSNRTVSTCTTLCDWDEEYHAWSYPVLDYGVGFCDAAILKESIFYGVKLLWVNVSGVASPRSEVIMWILDRDFYPPGIDDDNDNDDDDNDDPWIRLRPAVLDWRVNHTTCHRNGSSAACRSQHSYCRSTEGDPEAHTCVCAEGYHGNPYVPNGCTDVNECHAPEMYFCYGVCNNTEGGYQCMCPSGFVGNASVPNGCKDIDECAHPDRYSCYGDCKNMPGTFQCLCKHGTYGDPSTEGGCSSLTGLKIGLAVGSGTAFLLLAIGVPFVIHKMKLHKVKRMKETFFKENHGLLLQQLVSHKSDIGGRMIITLGELEKATNNFDPSHEVGGGGHGIVYKGLLHLQVVAIKKSKIIVQREITEFINEVAILSQINHRNIVKLLGCCLETEVPLLVYEFISNGTLAHHLHVEGNISLSWNDRLRIALEISKAIAYLHSAASMPILHRDIKSSNILIDDNLTAKISDFGASKYIPIDQTGVTTAVQGTIGYLDPMYYYTSHLTDKSDVFSFGVLLMELLTRKKPFVYRTTDGDGLVSHFASLLVEGGLVGIIDPQIMEEAEGEQVKEVAMVAAMCTKLNREDRPTIREVEMTLENLRNLGATKKHAHHNTTTWRYQKDQTAAPYFSFEAATMEASKHYTMEEEILLSGTYPR